ncbi:hypothetical protein [Gaoshiqia sediminis]|uniref:Uncharacterized protein n=1 Tax=Gaoshiqia sediminis TaxID=2986998 RepID=A0AA41Y8Z6_9BACT|nr:hypothetical protein [Gaoshiqia sediminis]MCW0483791.1 hypothetical protein [Gaoshiqia sediminis]
MDIQLLRSKRNDREKPTPLEIAPNHEVIKPSITPNPIGGYHRATTHPKPEAD